MVKDVGLLESRAQQIFSRFDAANERKLRLHRPFMLEFFGTPKSGKSTMKEILKHFFKRNGWTVSAPVEGAEFVELPRDEPEYNFQTTEYALSAARERFYDKGFHIVIFDRAIFDGVVRMDYYKQKGIFTPEQHAIVEGYYLLPWMRSMFDLHICLVASPEIAIQRELGHSLTKKHGETMNPVTLQKLLDAHTRVWERLHCAENPSMSWHDSSSESPEETGKAILTVTLDAFERRLAKLNNPA